MEKALNFLFTKYYLAYGDNEQGLQSKVQKKNTKQEQRKHGPIKIRGAM